MQAPPPFPGQQRNPNKTLSTVLIVVSMSCIAICGFLGFQGFQTAKKTIGMVGPIVGCGIDMNAVGDGVLAYAKEKGKLPNKETWQSDVLSYVKKELVKANMDPEGKKAMSTIGMDIKQMDKNGAWGCKVDEKSMNGYAFNADLSGKKIVDIPNIKAMPLVFEIESQPAKNLAVKYKKLPDTAKPDVMGQPRKYMVFYADGSFDYDFSSGNSKAKVSVNKTP